MGTTTLPAAPENPDATQAARGEAPGPTLKQLKLRRLLATLPLATLMLSGFWGAIQSIFLALQVQTINPDGRVASLGLIISVGAIAAMLIGPVAGALTDRTRTRIGGRAPWILFGLVGSVAAALFLAHAQSVTGLLVGWVALQVASNFISTPLVTHIPALVPLARRGTFSALNGVATLVGAILGGALAAPFADSIATGYYVVSSLLILAVLAFVAANHRSNLGEPKRSVDVAGMLRTFWINAVRFPNFAWTFAGRFLLFSGYFTIGSYQLYVLQSYVGLGDDAPAKVALVGTVSLVGMLISTSLGGLLVDKIGRTKPIIYVSCAVLALGLFIPFLDASMTTIYMYAFLSGLGFGAFQAVDLVLVTQVLPSEQEAGNAMGIINITSSLPQTIGVAIAGIIVTMFDSFQALFVIAPLGVILGALLIVPVKVAR